LGYPTEADRDRVAKQLASRDGQNVECGIVVTRSHYEPQKDLWR